MGEFREKMVVACCRFLPVAPSREQLLAAGNKTGLQDDNWCIWRTTRSLCLQNGGRLSEEERRLERGEGKLIHVFSEHILKIQGF